MMYDDKVYDDKVYGDKVYVSESKGQGRAVGGNDSLGSLVWWLAVFGLMLLGLLCFAASVNGQEAGSEESRVMNEELAPVEAAVAAPVIEGEEPALIAASMGGFTDYVWRRDRLYKGWNAQGAAAISRNGFSLGGWFVANEEELMEVDLTASFAATFKEVMVEAGVIEYFFTNSGAENEREAFMGIFPRVLLSPRAMLYADLTHKGAFYGEAGVSQALPLAGLGMLTLGADLGYGNRYYNALMHDAPANALHGWGASAELELARLPLSVLVRYDENVLTGEGVWWGGLSVGMEL